MRSRTRKQDQPDPAASPRLQLRTGRLARQGEPLPDDLLGPPGAAPTLSPPEPLRPFPAKDK